VTGGLNQQTNTPWASMRLAAERFRKPKETGTVQRMDVTSAAESAIGAEYLLPGMAAPPDTIPHKSSPEL